MMWDNIVRALSGPLLVKLALAAVLLAAFLFLRRRDTEGVMTGFAFLAGILALRDLGFAFFPSAAFYISTDLIVFGLILYLGTKPFRPGWALWAPLAFEAIVFVLLILDSAFALFPGLPLWGFSLAALVPIGVNAAVAVLTALDSESPLAELGARSWLPLIIGSLIYVGASVMLGPGNGIFQGLVVPLSYALLFSLGFFYVDIIQRQLIRAVDYYEESVDSLYEMLLATGSAMKADFSLQDVLDNMLAAAVKRTGADGGLLLLTDEFEDAISVRSVQGSCTAPFKLPESLPRNEDRVGSFVRQARFRLGEGILGESLKPASTSLRLPERIRVSPTMAAMSG